jgi:hypothetical protein
MRPQLQAHYPWLLGQGNNQCPISCGAAQGAKALGATAPWSYLSLELLPPAATAPWSYCSPELLLQGATAPWSYFSLELLLPGATAPGATAPGAPAPWSTCSLELLLPGATAPWSYCRWSYSSLEHLLPGAITPWSYYSLELLLPGAPAPWSYLSRCSHAFYAANFAGVNEPLDFKVFRCRGLLSQVMACLIRPPTLLCAKSIMYHHWLVAQTSSAQWCKPGNTNILERLCTIDLLIKVACFRKEVNNV